MIFGSIIPGAAYQARPAAYAVITGDGGTIAVVGYKGRYFLPGGGSLPGEAPEETVEREVREELARGVRITGRISKAIQYFPADGRHYRMEAVFFAAEFTGEPTGEGEHQLHWLDPGEIEQAFFHESHAWAARLAVR
ncbi:MAG TPA: NUDIX domain-containing protein [Blastocatellia bacterium]|nr:NUDIX domain-containing protein [Blastocatellia bacterium]